MDAVRVGDKWFGCVLGAGSTPASTTAPTGCRGHAAGMRYNLAILAELRVFRPLPFVLEVDGERWETEAMLVAVGNAKSYGAGMKVMPGAEVDDGVVDVMVLGPVSKPEFLKTFPRVFKGTHITPSRRHDPTRQGRVAVVAWGDGVRRRRVPRRPAHHLRDRARRRAGAGADARGRSLVS